MQDKHVEFRRKENSLLSRLPRHTPRRMTMCYQSCTEPFSRVALMTPLLTLLWTLQLKCRLQGSSSAITSRPSSSDVLIDPFDGNVLGVLLPQGQGGSDSQNPSQVNLANNPLEHVATGMNSNPAGSEAVWSQLSRVLDIQGEISKMHLEMETIGLNSTRTGSDNWKRSHWKRHHKAPPENVEREDMSGVNWPRQRAVSTVSTISSSGEPEGGEAGANFQDDEEEKGRIRGEEFAKLSSQFEGRKEAIHDIMAKASQPLTLPLSD
jgi:hypothetical protein